MLNARLRALAPPHTDANGTRDGDHMDVDPQSSTQQQASKADAAAYESRRPSLAGGYPFAVERRDTDRHPLAPARLQAQNARYRPTATRRAATARSTRS